MMLDNKTTYETALGIYAMVPPAMLLALLKTDAPYGRFSGKFIVDCSYSGKSSWFMMEVVSPIAFLATILSKQLNHEQWILTSCWMLHYIHRSIVYPLRAPSMAPIHIFASFSAVLFNLLNGYTNAYFIGHHPGMNKAGLVVWAMGFASNVYHDNLLFQLRDKTGKANYFIPYGGLFAYVSCPNYFSEVVEWTGFAIAANPSVPACLFVAATLANLFPRAWRTHQWYKKQFKHYPSSRKAVVPFLF